MKNARRTHTIVGSDLASLFVQAVQQGKTPKYVVRFEEAGIEVECTIRRFKQ